MTFIYLFTGQLQMKQYQGSFKVCEARPVDEMESPT
jgi:hypothetical protein